MKRLINNGDIFDKYVSFEDKKFRDDTIKQFNWLGHRNIAGTYKGAAYTTSLADNYMANNLRNDSNPKGSLLVAAKNYTDSKVAAAGTAKHTHYISLNSTDSQICFTYISDKADKYTIETLKSTLNSWDKRISCTGYWDVNPAIYIFGNGTNLKVGYVKNKATQTIAIDFVSITDYVE